MKPMQRLTGMAMQHDIAGGCLNFVRLSNGRIETMMVDILFEVSLKYHPTSSNTRRGVERVEFICLECS